MSIYIYIYVILFIYIYIYVILFIIVYQIISIVIGMFNMHFCIFLNRFKMFQNVSMRLSRFLSCHTALLLGPWARNNCKAQHFQKSVESSIVPHSNASKRLCLSFAMTNQST